MHRDGSRLGTKRLSQAHVYAQSYSSYSSKAGRRQLAVDEPRLDND